MLIFCRFGTDVHYDVVGERPGRVNLNYRAQHKMDGQRPLSPQSILNAATAFQDRIKSYTTAGKSWNDFLDDRAYSGERDIETDGIFIILDPPSFFGRTTLERAWQILAGLKLATTDMVAFPGGGAIEEALIASSVGQEGSEIFVCNMHLRKDTPVQECPIAAN